MLKGFSLVAVFIAVMFISIVNVSALSKITPSSPSSTIDQGQTEQINFSLINPIICLVSGPTCNVQVSFSSDDPASIRMDNPNLTWGDSEWFQARQIIVTGLAPSNCQKSETDTITATAISNAEYYSNYVATFTVTINSEPPYSAPDLANHNVNLTNDGNSVNTDVTQGVSGCPDESTLTVISGPTHGTAVDPPGTITYTPNSGYSGTDSLTYMICSILDSSVCSTATINYVVSANEAANSIVPDTGYGQPMTTSSTSELMGFTALSLIAIGFGISKLFDTRSK